MDSTTSNASAAGMNEKCFRIAHLKVLCQRLEFLGALHPTGSELLVLVSRNDEDSKLVVDPAMMETAVLQALSKVSEQIRYATDNSNVVMLNPIVQCDMQCFVICTWAEYDVYVMLSDLRTGSSTSLAQIYVAFGSTER